MKDALDVKKIINIALAVLLVVFLVLFICFDTVYLKASTSLCFVLAGLLYFDLKSDKAKCFPVALMLGIIMCLVGDVTLFYSFEVGAVAFAIGHICYSVAHYSLCKFKVREIFFTAAFFAVACALLKFTSFVDVDPKLLPVCFGYSLIISFMVSKSISNLIEKKDLLTLLVCIGSVVFFISDMMVFFNTFNVDKNNAVIFKNIGHILYFPAQYVIAQAIRVYYQKSNSRN